MIPAESETDRELRWQQLAEILRENLVFFNWSPEGFGLPLAGPTSGCALAGYSARWP